MALEDLTGPGKFISALNPAWPVDDDWVDEGDNHLRGIKNVLKNTFPALDGPVTLTDEQMNGVLVAAPESRIINGNFAIDQRNNGAEVTANAYAMDRWATTAVGGGVIGTKRGDDGVGGHELQSTVRTADATIAAGDAYFLTQKIEGVNVKGLQWGSGGASPVTMGFAIQAPVAGVYTVAFRNSATTASYVKSLTLAAGWNEVSFTVPGPTIGAWDTGNGVGIEINWGLANGTTYQSPVADSWQAGNFTGLAGAVNVMATLNAVLRLRNARLYPGTVDYGPSQRLYADELRLCQRYYSKSYNIDMVPGSGPTAGMRGAVSHAAGAGLTWAEVPLPVQMRATPTITLYSHQTGAAGFWRNDTADLAAATIFGSDNHFVVQNSAATTANMGFSGHWTASAEL